MFNISDDVDEAVVPDMTDKIGDFESECQDQNGEYAGDQIRNESSSTEGEIISIEGSHFY